jgi:hypothetical protein
MKIIAVYFENLKENKNTIDGKNAGFLALSQAVLSTRF